MALLLPAVGLFISLSLLSSLTLTNIIEEVSPSPSPTTSSEERGDGEMLPRIGIIGAGLSGTSSAYFLRQLFGHKVAIDIFEAEKVGGRTALITINGLKYESGASIIHKSNRYMVQFSNEFGASTAAVSHTGGAFGLYGTDGIYFKTSDWTVVSMAKLIWRYSISSLYTIRNWLAQNIFPKFDRIYKFQELGMAFTTVEDLLSAMGEDVLNMTKYCMRDVLLDAGLSQSFVEEFGMAAMRNNYGQTIQAHGFVGAVSMAGLEPGLWSVYRGNVGIAENLLIKSKSNLVNSKVSAVVLVRDDLGTGSALFEVEYEQAGRKNSKEYDIVIIATPVEGTKNKISFVDFPSKVIPFSQPYHKIVTMFVQGRINKTTFNLNDLTEFPPDLFTVKSDTFFNSIGKQSSVDFDVHPDQPIPADHAVWKTFLNKAPSEDQVDQLFDEHGDIRFVDWLAYPEYKPNMDLPHFILHDHLYYVNAIESAAAAMEMNVIGAKNVALLAYNQWYSNFDKIDEIHLPSESKEIDTKSEL